MTGEQANWLRKNPTFRAMSTHAPSGFAYQHRKMLHPDGTTTDIIRGMSQRVEIGSFEVAILAEVQDLVRR